MTFVDSCHPDPTEDVPWVSSAGGREIDSGPTCVQCQTPRSHSDWISRNPGTTRVGPDGGAITAHTAAVIYQDMRCAVIRRSGSDLPSLWGRRSKGQMGGVPHYQHNREIMRLSADIYLILRPPARYLQLLPPLPPPRVGSPSSGRGTRESK